MFHKISFLAVFMAISTVVSASQTAQGQNQGSSNLVSASQSLFQGPSYATMITSGSFAGLTEAQVDQVLSQRLADQYAQAKQDGQAARTASIAAAAAAALAGAVLVPTLPLWSSSSTAQADSDEHTIHLRNQGVTAMSLFDN